MMLQIRNLTSKLVNLEYDVEGKSCTESLIIGVKSLLPVYSQLFKLIVSIREFIIKKFEFCQSHMLSHIQIVHWVSGSPGVTYYQPCFLFLSWPYQLTMSTQDNIGGRNHGAMAPTNYTTSSQGNQIILSYKSTLLCSLAFQTLVLHMLLWDNAISFK